MPGLAPANADLKSGPDNTGDRANADPDLPRIWIRPYYASFNGLRGVAVFMVFLNHYGWFWSAERVTGWLWIGVDLFFVLSGFLITGILYDSLEERRYFRNFYIRRALRIFPVFYGFFLLLFLLTPVFHFHYDKWLLAFVFYFGNFVVPFADLVRHNPTVISVFHHGRSIEIGNIGPLWSLCVEEQFYLIWPAVVWLVRDRKHLMRLCVIVSIATLIGRCILLWAGLNRPYLLYWSIYTRCDTLLIGAWCALWLRGTPLSLKQLRRRSSYLFLASASALILALAWLHQGYVVPRFGYTLIALCSAAVLLQGLDDTSFISRVFRLRPVTALGVISYGFYFFHGIPGKPWHSLALDRPELKPVIPIAAFVATFVVAKLSFRYWETPFLRLKKVLAPQETGHAHAVRLHVPEPQPET